MIAKNRFGGNGLMGLIVQNGAPIVTGNEFKAPIYSRGAIVTTNTAAPKLRDNVIESTSGVAIAIESNSAPDVGSPDDPGRNQLGLEQTLAIRSTTPKAIIAVGNTFPHSPPSCKADIDAAKWASVAFSVSETCP